MDRDLANLHPSAARGAALAPDPAACASRDASSPVHRFACTACGRCCDRGPELELCESKQHAAHFILSLLLKVQSLPLNERSVGATDWWQRQGSRLPPRAAIEENRRLLEQVAVRRQVEREHGCELFLTISAIADDDGSGRCVALKEGLCSIYDQRPLMCRTVPMHYSRPTSTLGGYLERFAATPNYRCDTGPAAPVVLKRNTIEDQVLRSARVAGLAAARADRTWKIRMVQRMLDPSRADAAQLPSYQAVLSSAASGYATTLPIIVAWKVGRDEGLLAEADLVRLCREQVSLLEASMVGVGSEPRVKELSELLELYRWELARLQAG